MGGGPINLLNQMQLLKNLTQEIINTILPTFKRLAWYANLGPGPILQSKLCSQIEEEQREAINKIIKLREAGSDPNSL